jgi:hypothetical protein
MKIKQTTVTTTHEIECNAEELRQSNTIADGILGMLRRSFNGPIGPIYSTCEEADYEETEGEDATDN